MRLTKPVIKKIIGYLSSIIVLIFLGEPALDSMGTMIELYSQRSNLGM